jgi:hypothetical protein
MQDEQKVHHLHELGVDLVFLGGNRKHHVEEVLAVRERVLRVHERLTDRLFIGEGRDRPDLRHESGDREVAVRDVVDVEGVRVVARERRDHRAEDRHRMRRGGEALEEVLHVLVQQRMPREVLAPVAELRLVRKFAVDEQVSRLDEGRAFGELFDGDAAITQDALVAVDERDRAPRRRRVHEGGIERHVPRFRSERSNVDRLLAFGSDDERRFEPRVPQRDDGLVRHGILRCGMSRHYRPRSDLAQCVNSLHRAARRLARENARSRHVPSSPDPA